MLLKQTLLRLRKTAHKIFNSTAATISASEGFIIFFGWNKCNAASFEEVNSRQA